MSRQIGSKNIAHQVVRLEVDVQRSYDEFRGKFESAVPMWNQDLGVKYFEERTPWSHVVADVAASAPNEFLLYWKMDLGPLMSLAGNTRRATEYLMGNHVIAETMYRHDSAVALYVPLRCAIYDAEGDTRFTIEQPSTALSSLGHDQITQVGIDLDRKLARLFEFLGIEAPSPLLQVRTAP
jgi:hypothetical protein